MKLRRSCDCHFQLYFVRFRHPVMLLRCADKRISNIVKGYIKRNNLQLELYDTVQIVDFIHVYVCSMQYRPWIWAIKSSPAMLAYPPDGSRCACHAYQNVSNTNQFDQSRKGIELTFIHEIIMIIQFDQKVKYSFMQHICRCYAIFKTRQNNRLKRHKLRKNLRPFGCRLS